MAITATYNTCDGVLWSYLDGRWVVISSNGISSNVTVVGEAYGQIDTSVSVNINKSPLVTDSSKKDPVIKKKNDDYYTNRFEILDLE